VVIDDVEDLGLAAASEGQWVMSACQRSLGISAWKRM
jgi:hypothetical protein